MGKVNGIRVQENTTYNDVMTYGTKAQQRAFFVFDKNHDKIMQKDEAESFNLYKIKLRENSDKSNETLIFNSKNNEVKLELTYSADNLYKLYHAEISNHNFYYCTNQVSAHDSFDMHLDTTSENLEVKRYDANTLNAINLKNLNISNCRVNTIFAYGSKNIEIYNTKGNYNISSATLYINQDTNIGIMDKKSRIDIIR